jgi:hypothetical protein
LNSRFCHQWKACEKPSKRPCDIENEEHSGRSA